MWLEGFAIDREALSTMLPLGATVVMDMHCLCVWDGIFTLLVCSDVQS